MSSDRLRKAKRFRQEAGIALITTLMLMFLMSSLLVGFTILLASNQQLTGSNNDDVSAFYGAEAGMEQLTANLGNLFAQTYSPTLSQVQALATTPGPPSIPGLSYLNGDGSSGYTITLPSSTTYDANGNPIPGTQAIKSGPYAGLTAFVTEYTLTVNARTSEGREVKLQRTTQTVGIPVFSFGIFSDVDLSFFPGPNFNFGGRTHTNGNLWLAAGSTLSLSDKVDAYKDVIRTELINGYNTSSNYAGTVQVTTNPGSSSYRTLGYGEGSYDPAAGTSNANWPTISTGPSPTDYNHNLINGLGAMNPKLSTGADKLNLAVAILGSGSTQPIDLIRRATPAENSNITGERYFAQASLRVLISDNATDIMNLPCIDASTQPFDLKQMANPVNGASGWAAGGPNNYAPLTTLYNNMIANNVPPVPLAASGATGGTAYSSTDGYWQPAGYPVTAGFIKIEEQLNYSVPCGKWKDVTTEVLGYGYVGRNINPVPQSYDGLTMNPEWQYTGGNMQVGIAPAIPTLPVNPANAALGFQNGTSTTVLSTASIAPTTAYTAAYVSTPANPYTCPDPHPFAIIRLGRIRDNPSSVYYNVGPRSTTKPFNYPYQSNMQEVCGVNASTSPITLATTRNTGATWVPQPTDVWPNVLFDTREGELRDVTMSTKNLPTLNGAMSYIEVDAKNLTNWFAGKLGGITTSGQGTRDASNASNDFLFYISDRRGNYEDSSVQTITGGWPPLSYTQHETGEYGWTDIVNGKDATNGCPNNTAETGEDENNDNQFAGSFYYYGAGQSWIHGAGITPMTSLGQGQLGVFKGLTAVNSALTTNSNCAAVPSYSSGDGIWPMMVATQTNSVRENPPLFFRRAVKIVNGNNLTAVGACPGGNNCGLSIATENPVYLQGDYNSNSGGNGFSDPYVASAISADAVTLLSDNWNDINSFATPYNTSNRNGVTSYYRLAVLAGATTTFPQPSSSNPQDFGTDGGVHNFLRYIENWGGTLNYLGSIAELYHSRQANGTFKCCNTVYSPPNRGYNFDTGFLNPLLLPPRTPLFRDVNTTGWTRLMLASQ